MELTTEACAILTPVELRQLRRLAGWTLQLLSQNARIHIAQLSEYENGRNGLRPDQLQTCRGLLLEAAQKNAAKVAALVARENAAELAEVRRPVP